MRRIIWWVRRDLRLGDNATLHAALQDAAAVIPVFIRDPRLFDSPLVSTTRREFLAQSLTALDAELQRRESYLVVRHGRPERELLRLVRETEAEAVYFHRDYTPFARRRDSAVSKALEAAGVPVRTFPGNYLSEPDAVLKADDSPYVVFTPYRRRFERQIALPARCDSRRMLSTPPGIKSNSSPVMGEETEAIGAAGERAARRQLQTFVRSGRLERYAERRNDLAADETSHLSPHLHFGTLSAADAFRAAHDCDGDGARTWAGELIWREFYMQLLWHSPDALNQDFRKRAGPVLWQNEPAKFEAWAAGQTGYPIVDAPMRQLNATGWLPNRARMIVASFLVKDLLQDWRLGERCFRARLVDAEVASNSGGWQWAAGTGADAQPFVRIFNPITQGRRFDANGAYVRRWLPELRRVPDEYVHEPWTMPDNIARTARVKPGHEYPLPIVDHRTQRQLALALYRKRTMTENV